jgi:hypothetical protein
MKKSLYNISQEYMELADQLTDGEATPELETALAINETELQTKGACYGMIVKEMEADCEIIDMEIKRLTALKKSRENAIDRLKANLSGAMQLYGLLEIKTPIMKINFRKSESVEVTDMEVLPEDYKTTKLVEQADKVKLKADIKAGFEIPGAQLVTKENLQIK